MKLHREHWATLTFAAALLLLGVVSWMAYRSISGLVEAVDRQGHTLKVLARLDSLLLDLTEAEANKRGYILTGQEEHLRSYESAQEKVQPRTRELRRLTADSPTQQERLDCLEPLIARRLSLLRESLEQTKGKVAVVVPEEAVYTQKGKQVQDEIRLLVLAMEYEESSLLHERDRHAQVSASAAFVVTLLTSLIAVLLLGAANLVLRREIGARRLATAKLQVAHDDLERRVEERTHELRETNEAMRHEITGHLHAEEARLESEERYHRLLEVCPDAIFTHRDGRISYANSACLKLLGATREQLRHWNPLKFIHPDYHDVVRARISRMLTTGEPVPLLEEKIIRFDGTIVDVEIAATPFTEQGETAIQVVLRDITERKKLEAQLLRSQRLESIGTLAGGIAHDLNNVLTPVLMAVKLLKKDRPEADRRALLATAQASAERGAEMIRQLLAFAGGVEGQRSNLRLQEILDEVKGLLEHTLPKSIRIRVESADGLWPVQGDATQLAQVLLNLCVNARDAMPDGGTLTVTAANTVLDGDFTRTHVGARPGPHVLVTVADTGAGIPAEVLDKIFDPFFTTKPVGKGTGLGLSTVLGIVKGHGGFVNVYSEVGHGTQMAVYLPALQTAVAEPVRRPQRDVPEGHGELILVADDEAFIQTTVKALLEGHGYRVLTASDGAEAVACYRAHRGEVRAVLLDMMMPVQDGPATLRALRELDLQVRVIAASGLCAAGRVAEMVAAGAQAFLQKPYSDEQLLGTLGEVLGAR